MTRKPVAKRKQLVLKKGRRKASRPARLPSQKVVSESSKEARLTHDAIDEHNAIQEAAVRALRFETINDITQSLRNAGFKSSQFVATAAVVKRTDGVLMMLWPIAEKVAAALSVVADGKSFEELQVLFRSVEVRAFMQSMRSIALREKVQ